MIGCIAGLWVGAAVWLDARGRRPPPPGPYDAIIVAGCAVWPGGRPSPALERRVRHAVALFDAGVAPRIVLTGGVGRHGPAEAVVAAELCVALGVDPGVLIIEDRSTTTLENAACTVGMVSGRLLVVSDAYHIHRCVRAFRRFHPGDVQGSGVAGGPKGRRAEQALREAVAVARHELRGSFARRVGDGA